MEEWARAALDCALDKVAAQSELSGFPHISDRGRWITTSNGAWTGGFWIGLLWASFIDRNDLTARTRAQQFVDVLAHRCGEAKNHDLGMMFYPSAVHGLNITQQLTYRETALRAAETLAKQFNPAGGFIPGWGFFGEAAWEGSVLIDTMMNLPLLLWAYEATRAEPYLAIATRHAQTTVRHHLREDGSTFHVFRFDVADGKPLEGVTYQGADASSCWSRGQAWAICGFTLIAEATGASLFAEAAERAARYFILHLPDDLVPYWDFSVFGRDVPRDSSAAAIAAFGLLRLASVTGDQAYERVAQRIIHSLSDRYLERSGRSEGILLHATADLPHGLGIDESTIYGDYYFVKALREIGGSRREKTHLRTRPAERQEEG